MSKSCTVVMPFVDGWIHSDTHCSHNNRDRKSTRLNSSHLGISYAVFCLKKKKKREMVYVDNLVWLLTIVQGGQGRLVFRYEVQDCDARRVVEWNVLLFSVDYVILMRILY